MLVTFVDGGVENCLCKQNEALREESLSFSTFCNKELGLKGAIALEVSDHALLPNDGEGVNWRKGDSNGGQWTELIR